MIDDEKLAVMQSAQKTGELLDLVHKQAPDKTFLGFLFKTSQDQMKIAWVERERMIWFEEPATRYSPEDFDSIVPSGLFSKDVTPSMEAVYPWEYPNLAPPLEGMTRHILFWAANEEEEQGLMGSPVSDEVAAQVRSKVETEWETHLPEGGADLLLIMTALSCGSERKHDSLSLEQVQAGAKEKMELSSKEITSLVNQLSFMGILRTHGLDNTQKYRINPEWKPATKTPFGAGI